MTNQQHNEIGFSTERIMDHAKFITSVVQKLPAIDPAFEDLAVGLQQISSGCLLIIHGLAKKTNDGK